MKREPLIISESYLFRALKPKSICIVDDYIVLGGAQSAELVVTYSIKRDEFKAVEMPYRRHGKAVDDLLQKGTTVIAVDNIVYPKYIIEYDFKDPEHPVLAKSYRLPDNGTYESIKKGTLN